MKNNTILGTLHLGFPKSTYLRNLDNAISVCNCKWPGIPAQSPRFSLVLKHSKVADVIIDYLLICRLPWTFWRGICSIVHIGVLILVEKTSMKGQRWDHTRISDGGTTRLLISLNYGEGVRGAFAAPKQKSTTYLTLEERYVCRSVYLRDALFYDVFRFIVFRSRFEHFLGEMATLLEAR